MLPKAPENGIEQKIIEQGRTEKPTIVEIFSNSNKKAPEFWRYLVMVTAFIQCYSALTTYNFSHK